MAEDEARLVGCNIRIQNNWVTIPPLISDSLYGCLPELEFDGETLGQSHSIARFLAREFGLAGKTNVEAAKADGIVDAGIDLANAGFKFR